MKAIVAHSAKDLRVDTIPDAATPLEGEVRVTLSRGGICGSDLHYYHSGGVGSNIRLQEPMILGHEVSGVVDEVHAPGMGFSKGDKVAVNPSMPCGECRYCRRDMRNQCEDMRFFGSAMRFPHQQGLFRQSITLPAIQLVKLRPDTDLSLAACAEPLAVALNAIRKAGSLLGKRVLVSGCGPIGCLMVMSAIRAGAHEVIGTDLSTQSLQVATQFGAMQTLDMTNPVDIETFNSLKNGKGNIDILFECSGSAQALESAFEVVRPQGMIITVGMGGNVNLPLGLAVTKEICMQGSFRFDSDFELAADLIDRGLVDVSPLVSRVIPMVDAVAAFQLASDRSQAMKVQIDFES